MIKRLNFLFLTACIVLLIPGFLGQIHWVLDLFNHFRYQLAAAILIGSLILFLNKEFRKFLYVLPVLIYVILSVTPYLSFRANVSEPTRQEQQVTILHANLYTFNKDHHTIISQVKSEKPDVAVFLETNEAWVHSLRENLPKEYELVESIAREDHFGLTVFSRLPVKESRVEYLGSGQVPSFYVVVEKEKKEISLWATHPYPPANEIMWRLRNEQLRILRERVEADPRPTILVGDLNTTPWSSSFKALQGDVLLNSGEVQGMLPTWPSEWPLWMRIPIDHVLHTKHFETVERRVLGEIGSDHFPVFVSLKLKKALSL